LERFVGDKRSNLIGLASSDEEKKRLLGLTPGHGPLVPAVFEHDDVEHGRQHLLQDLRVDLDDLKRGHNFLRIFFSESCGLYYKCFTIVIYDHNDSGQYNKTRIMIIIDDPS
jgi:hypothetical protein